MPKDISVVLGSYNRKAFLKLAIESIRKELSTFNLNSEIIVIDGGSTDGSAKWLLKQKDIITIVQHNHGEWRGTKTEKKSWGYFMNLGFKCAQSKYICMLSDDCLVVPGALKNGLELFKIRQALGHKIGGVAFYWRDYPGTNVYWVGTQKVDKIMINHGIFFKPALDFVNYIDEVNYKFYYADSDLCLRLWSSGYKIIVSSNSFIEHFSHANLKNRKVNALNVSRDYEYFLMKWEKIHLPSNEEYSSELERIVYIDKSLTYKNFRKASKLNLQCNLSRLKKYLTNKLK